MIFLTFTLLTNAQQHLVSRWSILMPITCKPSVCIWNTIIWTLEKYHQEYEKPRVLRWLAQSHPDNKWPSQDANSTTTFPPWCLQKLPSLLSSLELCLTWRIFPPSPLSSPPSSISTSIKKVFIYDTGQVWMIQSQICWHVFLSCRMHSPRLVAMRSEI